MKIMVIEDEIHLLEIYEEMISANNHEVHTFSDPLKALELLEGDFDLIISDKKMPKMTGLEVIEEVEKSNPNIPIFLITGDNNKDIDFKNPKSLLLRKPISFEFLFEKINSLK